MSVPDFKIGDKVRVIGVPDSVLRWMPEVSQAVFKASVGRVYKITDVRSNPDGTQDFELFVDPGRGEDGELNSFDSIWLEPEYLEPAS